MLEEPDYQKFPRLRDLCGFETVVGPGDLLYIPNCWWHQVETLHESTVSITFWYKVRYNLCNGMNGQLPLARLIMLSSVYIDLSTTWMSNTIDWEYSSNLSLMSISSYVGYETGNIHQTQAKNLKRFPKFSLNFVPVLKPV